MVKWWRWWWWMRGASVYAFLRVAYDAGVPRSIDMGGACSIRQLQHDHMCSGLYTMRRKPCAIVSRMASLSQSRPYVRPSGSFRWLNDPMANRPLDGTIAALASHSCRLLSGPGMLPHASPYARASVLLPKSMQHAPRTTQHAARTMQPCTIHRAPICIVHALSFLPDLYPSIDLRPRL